MSTASLFQTRKAHGLDGFRPDIIIATETWLNDTIKDSELESPGYTIYRRDRVIGTHGGSS